jgi:hypothetical protein
MIYLSCQPAIPRFTWEVEVYINDFIRFGVSPKQIHVVCGLDSSWEETPSDWIKLQNHFEDVNFFFYEDTRGNIDGYQPSIQAHLLHKHWLANPYLEKEEVFFHDADFIFTKPMDFTPFLQDDIWYFSDTISYIGYNYISSKGEDIINKMCEIAEIDKQIVKDNQLNSGGAQKLIKNVPTQYWKDVYDLQMRFWREIPPISAKIKKEKNELGEDYLELQHWTMSMWAELWMAWKYNRLTAVPEEFDFHFAIDQKTQWNKRSFFHNAGVLQTQQDTHFFKGLFDSKLPYDYELKEPNENITGYLYYQWIKHVGKNSCLI